MSFYPRIMSCYHVSKGGMYVNYGMPTDLINTSYSYIMSSYLHSHYILNYVFPSFVVSHHNVNCVMLSCLVSHHICEIVACYHVWLDNINVNCFMPSFISHYPLHMSIIQCIYIQLIFLFISHLNWRG